MTSPVRANRPPLQTVSSASRTPASTSEAKAPQAAGAAAAEGVADGFDQVLRSSTLANGVLGEVKAWASELRQDVSLQGVLKPTDVLRTVKDGDVKMSAPMKPGPIADGWATVKPGTVMHVDARARNGQLDLENIRIRFSPAIKGPLWTSVSAATVGSDGRIRLDVSGAPNISIGPTIPRSLDKLADMLGEMMAGGQAAESMELAGGGSDMVDLMGAQVSIQNVTFRGNSLNLGGAGEVTVGTDSRLSIEGSLKDLAIRGKVAVDSLRFQQDGIQLEGAGGSADLDLRLGLAADGTGTVKAALDNLNLATRYAVSQRKNGDFIALADGQLKNGSLRVEQQLGRDEEGKLKPLATKVARFDVDNFEGKVAGARLTVPDGKDTAQVLVGESRLSGNLRIDAERILLEGALSGQAEVHDYQGTDGKANLNLEKVAVKGEGQVKFDSTEGLWMQGGRFDVQADVNSATIASDVKGKPVSASVGDNSRISLEASDVSFTRKDGFSASGNAKVDLTLEDIRAGAPGMSLGGKGSLKGEGKVTVDSKSGVSFSDGALTLDAELKSAKVFLPGKLALDVQMGAKLTSTLTAAQLSREGLSAAFAPGTQLKAVLEGASLTLPGGIILSFKKGAGLDLSFDSLAYDKKGLPAASGKMLLEANITAGQVDAEAVKKLPGVQLTEVSGVEQVLRVELGRFNVEKDGSFALEELKYALEGRIGRLSGKLGEKWLEEEPKEESRRVS
jgi:hypothetical protein